MAFHLLPVAKNTGTPKAMPSAGSKATGTRSNGDLVERWFVHWRLHVNNLSCTLPWALSPGMNATVVVADLCTCCDLHPPNARPAQSNSRLCALEVAMLALPMPR
jgi:hypothetical protein